MSRVRSTTAALLAAGVLLAGCGYDTTEVPPAPSTEAAVPSAASEPTCQDALQSYAPQGTTTGPSLQAIRERGRLVVGVSGDTRLLGARNPLKPGGPIEGFDVDVATRVAEEIFGETGHLELRVITAAQRIETLEDGTVDIVTRNMTMNCERWEEIAFSAQYYAASQKVLVTKGTPYDEPEDLAGLRVCAPAGSTSITNIVTRVPDAVPVAATNHTGCLVKFQDGEVDAITGDDTVLAGLAAQDPYAVVPKDQPKITDEPYGIGVNAENVDLARFVNRVLEEMRADGSWQESYDEWLAPVLGPGSQPQPQYGRTG
ncbi:glutamate ABC transporter substrate-binding protein [Nocardioides dongkuii]|uniref:glutamate ABC transporter substrate-binding protein n=1 Tax=Nocardioides dongkuii TaxID=2760089 RepID=UPI0015FE537F|nr:glutamate ABC transporter substrate-binding protein [Nocardioides dongkuii]